MAAPTPVSAYLHAAAMVKAGVYLVARMTPGFADSPAWRPIVVTLGLLTMLLAGWRAVREYDLKLILAFGTVSQLGLITLMVGAGGGDLMLAGLAMLCAHAMFKAALFMVVGIIDHATGTRDIRRLAWLGRPAAAAADHRRRRRPRAWPRCRRSSASSPRRPTSTTLADSASLGVRRALRAGRRGVRLGVHHDLQPAVPLRCVRPQGPAEPSQRVAEMHRPPAAFLVAPAILAAAGLVFGVWPTGLDHVLDDYADTVPGGADYHLALWHGVNLPLLLSVLVLAAGIVAFFGRNRLRRARVGYLPLGNADRIYDAVIRGADVFAVRLTALTQRGSIPATQAVILSTLVLLPDRDAGARRARPSGAASCGTRRCRSVVGLIILAAALSATVLRNRLAAVLLVGVTGYGCGAIFVFHGAPDLALTQFLVETLTLVIFVLVLRTLPAEAEQANINRHRLPRVALSLAVGASVTALAVFAMAARTTRPIADLLPDAAYYRGHGANTVNVLLVDIRAWDTMGEISVLLVAATGVASMVFRNRRFGAAPRVADAGQPDIGRIPVLADQPGRRRHHLAARQRTARPPLPVAGPRGRDANHLPAHHGAVVLLLLRRPQHPRRRLRGRADRRPRAGAALPGRRPLRTRRGAARRRGQGARRRVWPCRRAPRSRRCCWARRCCRRRSSSSTCRCSGTSSSSPRCSSTSAST